MSSDRYTMSERTNSTPLVTVIMPVYNAANTVQRAIMSVLDTPRRNEIEIVIVDDCSTDDTKTVVIETQKNHPNISFFSMAENSGGPSAPRNLGIEKARGEYVTFLDDDDWIDAGNLLEMADHALKNQIDFLKGYLIVVKGRTQTIQNRLPNMPQNTENAIKDIFEKQSTTSDMLVRRELFHRHGIRYCTDLKIGEDTVITAEILTYCTSVEYYDSFFLYYNQNALDNMNVSSTQRYSDREVNHQITAWERTEKILSDISVSYYDLRLHAGLRNLLTSIVRFSNGISVRTYRRLHSFCLSTKAVIHDKMNLHKRYEELYHAILEGDYQEFMNEMKLRLLIAGYDLKFILPVIPYLTNDYHIRVDEWTGHNIHDKKQSEECSAWADIIWCEWLLGNAVFYSKLKNNNQRFIIRAHRFEFGREFGKQLDYTKVDFVIAVSYYYFEQFAERFSIPREKMRLLPNYVEDIIYSTKKSSESRFHIGLAGILPARKGFRRGLELLVKLKEKDARFKLYVMGNRFEDTPWLQKIPAERDYYSDCEVFIRDNDLSDAVVYGGYVEREKLYNDIGYVLSLSDPEFPESFHLAPAEGACASSIGLLLRWPGVEYIYPKDVIFDSLDEMAAHILRAASDDNFFADRATYLRDYVVKNYRIDRFLEIIARYLKQLFVMG